MKFHHSIDRLSLNPPLLAAVVTAASCAFLLLLSESLNKDAIIYLHAADEFKSGGWAAAESAYPRPFFSVLIGSLSQLTSLSSAASAQIVITILAALSSFAFVKFIKDLGYTQKTQLIAAAIIFAYPGISAYRDYIIRDFGYWAFVFLSLSAAVKHHQSGDLIHAVEYVMLGAIATLFRPEAITFLLVIPFASLFISYSITTKAKPATIARNFATLAFLIVIGAYLLTLFFNIHIAQAAHSLVLDTPIKVLNNISENWKIASNSIDQHLLNQHSREYASASVAAIYFTIFSAQLLNGLTWFVAALAVYIQLSKSWLSIKNPIWGAAILACTIPLVVFLVSQQFLQTRYTLLLCLILLIPVCISLANSFKTHGQSKLKIGFLITVFSLAILDNHISTGSSKTYIGDSINWLKHQNTHKALIASNNLELSYKTNKTFDFTHSKKLSIDNNFPFNIKPSQFEFIAWQSDEVDELPSRLVLEEHPFTVVKTFKNKDDDGIAIYQSLQPHAE